MKDYRVLNIMDSKMDATNQRISICELVEVEYIGFTLPNGNNPYTFGHKGKFFIIDLSSSLAQEIRWKAENEEVVSLDMYDFRQRDANHFGKRETLHFHRNVVVPGLDEIL